MGAKILNATRFTVFNLFKPNVTMHTLVMGGCYWLLNFLAHSQLLKRLWGWKFHSVTAPAVSSDFSRTSWQLSWKHQLLHVLAICEILNFHSEILTHESMGNPKVRIISRTADHRVIRGRKFGTPRLCVMKYACMHVGTFHVRLVEDSLGSFGAL